LSKGKITVRDLRKFEQYLSEMHKKALEIMGFLGRDAEKVRRFFKRQYPGHKEQYWSVKKLYSLAMYLPMFLQIGMTYFKNIIYIDTHAGPGLAKLGPGDNEIVLGSPLLSIVWPEIVATRHSMFKKVRSGFTKYVFIEKDYITCRILHHIVKQIAPNRDIDVRCSDSNYYLPRLADEISNVKKSTLLLLFVDPFGSLNTQLVYSALSRIISVSKGIDIVLNVMSGELVRAFASLLKDPGNFYRYKKYVKMLFGDTCEDIGEQVELCKYYLMEDPPADSYLSQDSIVKIYDYLLRKHGFKAVYVVPVEYRGKRILYHLVFASKAPNASSWLERYVIKYLGANLPRSYGELKSLFLKITKRGPLDRYFA